ncbi:MAG: TA system VapC family ribonuclease toxin [Thermoanaerobaculia bacterium]
MSLAADLPDVNVWLALRFAEHVHHERARRYWYEQALEQIAFCRVTALGFLRLATNENVTGGYPLSLPEAWSAYRRFRGIRGVSLATEPEGCEAVLDRLITKARLPPRLLTDAYLAGFAEAGGFRLVTFDADFALIPGLDLLRLEV